MSQEQWDLVEMVVYLGLGVFLAVVLGGEGCGAVVLRDVQECFQ